MSDFILFLVHPQMLSAGTELRAETTESAVFRNLKRLGYRIEVCGLKSSIEPLEQLLASERPKIVFNFLEEFRGEAVFDFLPIAYLEARGIPVVGCNPRGLALSRNKLIVSQVAKGLGLLVPDFWTLVDFDGVQRDGPYFVKFVREHASLEVTSANRVKDGQTARLRAKQMRQRWNGEVMVQKFIAGADVSLSLIGNQKIEVLGCRLLQTNFSHKIATERQKFSKKAQSRSVVRSVRYDLKDQESLFSQTKRLYRALELSGYARFDYRLDAEGNLFLIDVNANPSLSLVDDFALSAIASGRSYAGLLEELMALAIRYKPQR